jgi:hypothetical protein
MSMFANDTPSIRLSIVQANFSAEPSLEIRWFGPACTPDVLQCLPPSNAWQFDSLRKSSKMRIPRSENPLYDDCHSLLTETKVAAAASGPFRKTGITVPLPGNGGRTIEPT